MIQCLIKYRFNAVGFLPSKNQSRYHFHHKQKKGTCIIQSYCFFHLSTPKSRLPNQSLHQKLVESIASPTPSQNQPHTPLLFPSPTARTELKYWTKRSILITLSPRKRKLTHADSSPQTQHSKQETNQKHPVA